MRHRGFLIWLSALLALTPGLVAAGLPVIRVLTPEADATLTWMPVTISIDFDAGADTGTLSVDLNGTDITAWFALDAPAGGRIAATATRYWDASVLLGSNGIDASIELGGTLEANSRSFLTQGDPFADSVVSYLQGDNGGFNAAFLPDVVLGAPAGTGLFQGSLDVVSLGRSGSLELRFDDNVIVDGDGVDFTVFENPFLELGAGSITQPPFAEPARVSVSQDGLIWFDFPCSLTLGAGPYWPGCTGVYPVLSDGTLSTPHASLATSTPIEDLVGLHILSIQAPEGSGGDSFDLANVGLAWARYVRIESADFDVDVVGPGNSAADIDAVAAVNSSPAVPLAVPASTQAGRALWIGIAVAIGVAGVRRRERT